MTFTTAVTEKTQRATFDWTDDTEQQVKDLWGIETARTIAEIIGTTRNSVIGKARRLKLDPIGHRSSGRTKAPPKPRIQRFREIPNTGAACLDLSSPKGEGDPSVMPDSSRPGNPPCTLLELTDETCRWPQWEDTVSDRYCGAPPVEGLVYCNHHSRMAYQPRRPV